MAFVVPDLRTRNDSSAIARRTVYCQLQNEEEHFLLSSVLVLVNMSFLLDHGELKIVRSRENSNNATSEKELQFQDCSGKDEHNELLKAPLVILKALIWWLPQPILVKLRKLRSSCSPMSHAKPERDVEKPFLLFMFLGFQTLSSGFSYAFLFIFLLSFTFDE